MNKLNIEAREAADKKKLCSFFFLLIIILAPVCRLGGFASFSHSSACNGSERIHYALERSSKDEDLDFESVFFGAAYEEKPVSSVAKSLCQSKLFVPIEVVQKLRKETEGPNFN